MLVMWGRKYPVVHVLVFAVFLGGLGSSGADSAVHQVPICQHVHPKHTEVIHGTHIEPLHVMKKRAVNQPLRILLWYDQSVYRLDSVIFEIINNTILPEAVHFWEKSLFVRRVENVIRLTRKCNETQVFVKDGLTHCIDACRERTMCGEVEVPKEHLDACRTCNATGQDCRRSPGSEAGPGITDVDFVFYVSAMQTERCNKSLTVAYAAHCQQETALDRPIAGHANLCPLSINSTKPQELETLLSTVKHEILHALGFSVSLYAFYRDAQGNPLTPRRPDTGKPTLNEKLQTYQWSDRVIRTITRQNWQVRAGGVSRDIQMIVTPTVVSEVRDYFNCSKLEGAELEDQGEEGTALTHWEKRVFENEAMTGTHTQNPIISRITLALMEDTGWYRANYSMAEPMSWGKGLGCDFVMNSCKEWIARSHRGLSIHPFCTKLKRDPLQTECTDDRSSVALCNLVNHEQTLPKVYQNFDTIEHVTSGEEGNYGGSVSLADYCPYIQEFTWRSKNVIVRGSHCQYEDNNPKADKNFALEHYGKESRCFDHTNKMWEERSCSQMRQWQHWGSGCYRYQCEGGRLHILVGKYNYTCYHAHQSITIRIISNNWLHKGAIVCPPCNDICGDEFEKRGGMVCRPGEEAPPSLMYPQDELHCSGAPPVQFTIAASALLCAAIGALALIRSTTFS